MTYKNAATVSSMSLKHAATGTMTILAQDDGFRKPSPAIAVVADSCRYEQYRHVARLAPLAFWR